MTETTPQLAASHPESGSNRIPVHNSFLQHLDSSSSPANDHSNHETHSPAHPHPVDPAGHPKKNSRSLKLISVSFKELALDSPTFRAYVNFSFTQVDALQKWIDSLELLVLDHKRRNLLYESSFEVVNEIFGHRYLSYAIIDADYTNLDLNFASAAFKELLAEFLKFVRPNEEVERLLSQKIKKDMLEFYEIRRNFETIQSRYDLVLSKYSGLSKTKDPASLQEDAFQLAEIRKQYIAVSLDIAVAITNLTESTNFNLISVVTSIWNKNFDLKVQTKNFSSFGRYVRRIQVFQELSRLSINNLRPDMLHSKEQTVESTVLQHAPSKSLDDHNCALINPSTFLKGYQLPNKEKHGWLFMRTTVGGRHPRQIWVRRWCFVKNGIFGMLCLSPSKTFVQELDKVGVGLCNVRYFPEEDRRFCFELACVHFTLVLQAETVAELKNWLAIFEDSKQRAILTNDELAFEKYPPLLKEFACTSPTSVDLELTTTGDSQLLSDLMQHSLPIPLESGYLFTVYNAPIFTLFSRKAVASHSLMTPTTTPTLATANLWGSVNWGNYYLLDSHLHSSQGPRTRQTIMSESVASQRYPSFYPKRLMLSDAQLRSLLGPVMADDEYVLMVFRGIWIPNNRQELVGRCYITQRALYFYMNSLGFVSIVGRRLEELISFDFTSYDDYDILKVYELSGLSMKLKLFLDSGKLIKDQLSFILKNKQSSKPRSASSVLKELENLRSIHAKQEIERLRANYETKKEIIPSVVTTSSTKMDKPMDIKTNYNQEMKLIWDKVYDIPSKLLFHFLLGDESFILQKILPFIDARNENISVTLWNQGENQQLTRSFLTDTVLDNYEFRTTRINQKIERLINSKYYNILQRTQYFKFPGLAPYRITTRIIIYSLNIKNSKLLIYSKIDNDIAPSSIRWKIGNFLCSHFLSKAIYFKTEILDRDIRTAMEKIGPHAKVVKLIRLYGQISRDENPKKTIDNSGIIYISIPELAKVLFRKVLWSFLQIFVVIFQMLVNFVKSLKLNLILILLLGISFGYNILLTSRSTISYWTVSKAEKMVNEYTTKDNMITRSIHLKDIEEIIGSNHGIAGVDEQSQCFANFKENSVLLNHQLDLGSDLQRSYRELGMMRNQLLVDLKMVNSLEEHLVETEWNNFITNELSRCEFVSQLPLQDENITGVMDYCASCKEAQMRVGSLDVLI